MSYRKLRTNTYDPESGDPVVFSVRARAIEALRRHYASLFGNAPELAGLRDAYAIPANALHDSERKRLLAGVFFWVAWACTTNRPGSGITYTHNWPAEELVGNHPTGQIIVWSVISFVLLLAGVGALAWYFAVKRRAEEPEAEIPAKDPLLALQSAPSMQATLKYFWVVAGLFLARMLIGAVTAHYGVEGAGFYGFPLAEWLPYALARTWHTQLGIFWIATAWLATGPFVAPAVSGHEPRFQRAGANVLFVCLLAIVVGSSVAFWNLVDAGLFGFLVNPLIALYCMQGLNTAPVHGHTALFGVYGMLGIGLMLFCLKGLGTHHVWKTKWVSFAFWSINIGLALMVLLSLLPVGLRQTWASVDHEMWYARSAEFLQTPLMETLRWLRVPGDVIFGAGVLALGWLVFGLKTGWSVTGKTERYSVPPPSGKAIEGVR